MPKDVNAASRTIYRLGFPKTVNAPPYRWLIAGLRNKGFVVGENLEVVYINLDNYQTESDQEAIRKEISEKCDLFFSGGAFLEILFTVKPSTPLLFLNLSGSNRETPATMQANTTGVRIGAESGIFRQAIEMLPADQRQKLGLIYFKGSKTELMAPGYIKTCSELGFELVPKEYADKENIGAVMRSFKKEGVKGLVLFPPAFRPEDMPELIKWQNKLKLPIISLIRSYIEKGLFGGPTINAKMINPCLTEYAAKILQGRSPGQLPVKFYSPTYVVNLATASKLGIEIPIEVVKRADIVGMADFANKEEKPNAPLLPGNFVLAVERNTTKQPIKKLLCSLAELGYVQGENLRLEHFDLVYEDQPLKQQELVKHLADNTNVIFATGNILGDIAKLKDLKTPVCFISTKESADNIPVSAKNNFTGVIRTSFVSVIDVVQQIVPNTKKIAMLGHAGPMMDKAIKRYQKAAKHYHLTIDNYSTYSNKDEIGPMMVEFQKNNDALLLFSPGMSNEDVKEIVEWQNRLGFPVLAQFEKDVRAGLLAGVVVDMDKTGPKLAEYIDKLMHGRPAEKLPFYYYPGKTFINLRTANMLHINIPLEFISHAEIIH